jgi:sulfite exporter TauE/SafE
MVALCIAAVSIAILHTLCGPDHYVPFVAMSRAGRWSLRKTVVVTLLCGLGHVGSSVVLGFIGILLGMMLTRLEFIEQVRGNVAGWLMIGFGLAYLAWSGVRSHRNIPHTHRHTHADGTTHSHEHTHHPSSVIEEDHLHVHALADEGTSAGHLVNPSQITPWLLFTIFIFGPCEPLIPLLMYPAAQSAWWGVALVSIVFLLATLSAMLMMVVVLFHGASNVQSQWLERHSHSMAGLVILICGLTITFGL